MKTVFTRQVPNTKNPNNVAAAGSSKSASKQHGHSLTQVKNIIKDNSSSSFDISTSESSSSSFINHHPVVVANKGYQPCEPPVVLLPSEETVRDENPTRTKSCCNTESCTNDRGEQELLCLQEYFRLALKLCATRLEAVVIDKLVQREAQFIYDSMNVPGRYYHRVHHVLDVLRQLDTVRSQQYNKGGQTGTPIAPDPYCILAILYHDCVYALPNSESLDSAIPQITMQDDDDIQTTMLSIIQTLFDEGHHERNEYYSALAAVRGLSSVLSVPELTQIVLCIEATIPFRSSHPLQQLHSKLQKVHATYPSYFPEETQSKSLWTSSTSIQRARDVAHADLYNFASQDPVDFLTNTWSLLPELYPNVIMGSGDAGVSMGQQSQLMLRELRDAVYKTHQFLNFLQGHLVFPVWNDDYSSEENTDADKLSLTNRNLEIGRIYTALVVVSLRALDLLTVVQGRIDVLLSAYDEEAETAVIVGETGCNPTERNTMILNVIRRGLASDPIRRLVHLHQPGPRVLEALFQSYSFEEESSSTGTTSTAFLRLTSLLKMEENDEFLRGLPESFISFLRNEFFQQE